MMRRLLRQYRQVQSQLRDLYDPFTAEHCPSCETPCCRKPVRVDIIDIELAKTHGCRLPGDANPEEERNRTAVEMLSGTSPIFFTEDIPCDFLIASGCAFPRDLRPHGCTRFICDPMKRKMDPSVLREIRRLIRKFDTLHDRIVRFLKGSPA